MSDSRRAFRKPAASTGPVLPPGSENWPRPWVILKYYTFHPHVFPKMLGPSSVDVRPGDLVGVYDRNGNRFGTGLYNPMARIPLRVVALGALPLGEEDLDARVDAAMDLRERYWNRPETDACRIVNSDGDGLGGLIVDRYADVLLAEVSSLACFIRLDRWLARMHARLGTKRHVVRVDPEIGRIEGIDLRQIPEAGVRSVRIREHGVRYEVNFEEGHKTGFFCDQSDNRLRLSRLVKDARMLDLCSYTGGFSLCAKVLGGAADVTAVDLDEKAVEQGKRNMNLNQVRINWVHADAFSYARQMKANGAQWDVMVLDPPKFVHDAETAAEGRRKYEDLNNLGLSLVSKGGLLVTCSCSGQLSAVDFEEIVVRAAQRSGRQVQILDRTGAGYDHPMMTQCPESRYLKLVWARVL